MNLKEKITADLVAAMKAQDAARVSTLRMLKAAVMKMEVSGKEKKDASDEEVLQATGKEVKQRRDSIEAYRKGGREDLAVKEEAELKILQEYLPAQLSDEELRAIIRQTIEKAGAHGKGDFGKVIGGVMGQVKGKADGGRVKAMIEGMLG